MFLFFGFIRPIIGYTVKEDPVTSEKLIQSCNLAFSHGATENFCLILLSKIQTIQVTWNILYQKYVKVLPRLKQIIYDCFRMILWSRYSASMTNFRESSLDFCSCTWVLKENQQCSRSLKWAGFIINALRV